MFSTNVLLGFGCTTSQSEAPQVQKTLEYVTNIWTYGPWYHSVAAIKVYSFSYISFRELELYFPVAELFIIFLWLFQISGIYPVILPLIILVNCSILESPKKSEPHSGHLKILRTFSFLRNFLSIWQDHLYQTECRNHLSLMLILVALNILPCTGLFSCSLWQRPFF